MDIIEKIEKQAQILNVPIIRKQSRQILLNELIKKNPKKILEVGTAIGYSGSLILNTCKTATLTTIEILQSAIDCAINNFNEQNFLDRVNIIQGDATEVIKTLQQHFDFIFLDGPKSKYIQQLPYLIDLLEINGVMLVDNVLFMGEVMGDSYPKHKHRTLILNLRKFIKNVQENPNLSSELINIEDGLMLIKRIK